MRICSHIYDIVEQSHHILGERADDIAESPAVVIQIRHWSNRI